MFKFLVKKHKKEFILGFLFLFLFALSRPIMSKLIILNMDMAKGVRDFNLSWILILNFSYLMYYLISNLFSEKYLDSFMIKSKDSLNRQLIRSTIFDRTNVWYDKKSDLVNIFTTDISTITDNYIQGIVQVVYLVISFVSATFLLISISIELLIYLLCISIISLYLQKIIIKNLPKKQDDLNMRIGKLTQKIIEINQNIFAIKTYGIKNKFLNEFDSLSKNATNKEFDLSYNEDKTEVINQFSATLIEVGLYTVGLILIRKNKLEISYLLSLIVTADSITLPIYTFSRVVSKFTKTKKVRERLEDLLNKEDKRNKEICPHLYSIKLKGLILKYASKELNRPINIDINIEDKILIKGKNGVGKSTLIKTLLKLHDEYEGEILINDSLDLGDIDEDTFWENISYMSQEMELFKDTIKNNIILTNSYDKDKYEHIKSLLNLRELSDSLEISENQNNLSGGQKQKILLARALYKDSSILFLDEPFRNIDKESLTNIYSYLMKDPRILIIIDHNIHNERYFNKILNISC